MIRELSVTVGMYENVRCIVGLQTFFLLHPSDKDLVKAYLTLNGKHLHEDFQGKFALKQGRFHGPLFAVFIQLSFFHARWKILFVLFLPILNRRAETRPLAALGFLPMVMQMVPVLSAGQNIRTPGFRGA